MPFTCPECGKETSRLRVRWGQDGTKREGCPRCLSLPPSRTILGQQVPGIPFKCTIPHWQDMDARRIDRTSGDGHLHVYRDRGSHSVIVNGGRQ